VPQQKFKKRFVCVSSVPLFQRSFLSPIRRPPSGGGTGDVSERDTTSSRNLQKKTSSFRTDAALDQLASPINVQTTMFPHKLYKQSWFDRVRRHLIVLSMSRSLQLSRPKSTSSIAPLASLIRNSDANRRWRSYRCRNLRRRHPLPHTRIGDYPPWACGRSASRRQCKLLWWCSCQNADAAKSKVPCALQLLRLLGRYQYRDSQRRPENPRHRDAPNSASRTGA
jgi:hypothetical protein